MSEETIKLHVTRYRPGQDSEPVMETFTVPYHEDWVILEGLNHIKDHTDGSLSYRWSCRMGICGSCGMMVNGEPKLTCSTFMREYYPNDIHIEPLKNFPVIRDLVVDITDFMEKLQSVKPWIIRESEKPLSEGEYLQSPQELSVYHQFTQCINCMICYAACPVYGLDSEFLGPAAITLAYRYNEDSRDQGVAERRKVIGKDEGLWHCSFVGECSAACPKHVDPAAAIQRAKVDTTKSWFKSILLPGGQK